MKRLMVATLLALLLFSSCSKKDEVPNSEQPAKNTVSKKETDVDVLSYRMGFDSTVITRRNFPEADADDICRGVKDAFLKPLEPEFNDEVFNRSLARYKKNKIEIDAKKRFPEFIRNKPISEKFMAEKAKIKGIKKFDNGVLLETLKTGTGDPVTMDDIVEINYQGWDAKNALFDSSFKRKRTSRFNLNDIIPGFAFGLEQMKKGGKYKLYIPQELAYGAKGNKERIEAGMALAFDIDIINIERGKALEVTGEKK